MGRSDDERPIGEAERRHWADIGRMSEAELELALMDAQWRLRNLYWIMDKDGKTVRFAPNAVQQGFADALWYRNLVPKARQRGFSTLVQILMLDAALFEYQLRGAVIAQDMPTALRIFRDKIKFGYDRLPPVIREMQPLTTDSKTELVLGGTNSSLYVATSTRGGTLQWLHVSEYGRICADRPDDAREIQTGALPSVSPSGITVIESTIEGIDGIFSDMCRQALARAQMGAPLSSLEYKLHFASWHDALEYEVDPRGLVHSKKDLEMFRRMEIAIGRPISERKRGWYVLTRDQTFSGDQAKMWSQYPTTIEEAFTVSTEGHWFGEALAEARVQGRIQKNLPYNPELPVNFIWDLGVADDIAVWCHQWDGVWDNFIGFVECSEVPFSVPLKMLGDLGFRIWGQTILPHDAEQRRPGSTVLKTSRDMIADLGVRNITVVPVIEDLTVGNNLVRKHFARYRFDEEKCKEGLVHLAGYKKPFNTTHGTWLPGYVKNGHQHAADAIRQHAQALEGGLMKLGLIGIGSTGGRIRRRGSARTT